MKEEITSEIKNLLIESQKEMLKLLKPETGESVREKIEEEMENEIRSFYNPTKSVRINSTKNNDPTVSRNTSYSIFSSPALEIRVNNKAEWQVFSMFPRILTPIGRSSGRKFRSLHCKFCLVRQQKIPRGAVVLRFFIKS